ncbi:Werner Syndrome exonuclease [Trifolium repens]|nr:Werner Syndrome exonuclease [Trifolium repens]
MGYVESFILGEYSIIKTTVTSDRDVVDAHILHFLSTSNKTNVLGFDTEWHLHDTQAAASRCATLHLGDGKSCLIIQLSCFGRVIPESLVNFLRLPNYTFVGFGIKDNVAKLEKYYGFGCRNAVELAPMAASILKKPRLIYCGVDEVYRDIWGWDLRTARPLNIITFEWGAFELSKELAKLATINVFSYYSIGNDLLSNDYE